MRSLYLVASQADQMPVISYFYIHGIYIILVIIHRKEEKIPTRYFF